MDKPAACPPWVVERLEPGRDLDAVLAIEASSFTNPWSRDMFTFELEHSGVSHAFVIRAPGLGVAGFCTLWVVSDEIHINNLAVRPDCRRMGAGLALLRACLAEAATLGGRRATLEVRRSNLAALRLYARFGFQAAGVRRAYYQNPEEDALVLWLDRVTEALTAG
ncbi:MAG: ribosomal protein S18-alanine N-acetyltransferase [Acidobacteria bacterium]|nr:ribosomal protein S18-alanine N-acetyltransferase [Acidobacteriota bacterium]